MPPKQTMSVKIDVLGGSLFLNGSAVTTIYDIKSSAWFKTNDIAGALGYANASSSVAQMISPDDKRAFKDISLHINSLKTESHARNVFVNQRGLIGFLRERDSSCNFHKIRDMSQSSNPARIFNAQVPTNTACVSDRVPGGRSVQNGIMIDVKRKTLLLNGIVVDTVYDTASRGWFKSNDVAVALGYTNASASVTQHVHTNHKLSFSDISLHKDSPQVSAHPRNIFINQSGLMSFLLDLSPSCSVHKIQNIGLSLKNNQPDPNPETLNNLGASRLVFVATHEQMKNQNIPRYELLINNHPITLIIDTNKLAWFKVNDIADALGYTNSSSLVSQHISCMDSNPFKDITIHKNSPTVNAHPRNIFINQKGLINILRSTRSEISADLAKDGGTNMTASDKMVLRAIYSCFKEFNRSLHTVIVTPLPYHSNTDYKNLESKGSTSMLNPGKSRNPTTTSLRSISYNSANAHPYECNSYWSEGYIFIVEDVDPAGNLLKVVQSTEPPDRNPNKHIHLKQQVHSAPKLLKLVKYFLSNWVSDRRGYNMPLKTLQSAVSTICNNFEKTLHTVYELTSTINHNSKQASTNLQPISKVQINALAASPKYAGEWIYIASSIPYANRNVFKVGSTLRLAKRLGPYQTGRLNEDLFHYFQVFPVHNCKSIDNHFIQFFLRPWCQLNNEGEATEMYCGLNFETLRTLVSEIINFHEKSFNYLLSFE
uniref:Bro-N domain-containing protein n=1 Tax=Lygus hesperus TaxID=30085 RepID=A0A0A9WD21_LYGHE